MRTAEETPFYNIHVFIIHFAIKIVFWPFLLADQFDFVWWLSCIATFNNFRTLRLENPTMSVGRYNNERVFTQHVKQLYLLLLSDHETGKNDWPPNNPFLTVGKKDFLPPLYTQESLSF